LNFVVLSELQYATLFVVDAVVEAMLMQLAAPTTSQLAWGLLCC
jgi:hypothetical protein